MARRGKVRAAIARREDVILSNPLAETDILTGWNDD